MNLVKPKRKGGEHAPTTRGLPARSLNKSSSAPSQGSTSWFARLGHKFLKSFSAIDSASRDRATQGLSDEERRDSVQQDTPGGQERQVPTLPEHADAPKRPTVSWKVLKKYVKGIFKQNEGRQLQERSSALPPIREGSQHLRPPAQQLSASEEAGAAQRNSREQGPPDPPQQHRPAISPTNMLVKADHLPAAMDREVWCIEDYMCMKKIHSGYASSVYQAVCRHSGGAVALKVYQPDLLHKISQHQLMREARLHARLAHPNIIKLYAAFQQEDGVVLVLELADQGDLLNLLQRSGARLSERRAVRLVISPLLHALYYLHSKAIIHRDIKLENILFAGPDMTLKLADFGLCLNIREERSVTRAGTLDYMAPEVLRCPTKAEPDENKERSDLAYNSSVDIWAVGVLAYELLNGVPPFTRQSREDTERLITKASQPPFLVDASDNAKDFIYGCLTKRSQQRPSAWQLLRYSWTRQSLRPSSSQRFRVSNNSRSNIQDASTATPRPVPARSSSLAARTQVSRPSVEPEIQEDEEPPEDRSSANMVLPNAMPGSSAKPFSSHAPSSGASAQPERRAPQPALARSWSVAARVPARPPNAAPAVDSVAAAARVMMLQRAAAAAAAAASSSQSAADAAADPPEPALSSNAQGSGSLNQDAAAEGAEGAATSVDSDRSSWMASVRQADSMAAERRSGRQLQHQLAVLYESASQRSAEGGSGKPRGRALAEDMSVDSACLVRNGDLERAYSDLSRHTTDAGYRSGT